MWGVDIKEFNKNSDAFLNDFLRDDEVLAIETKDRTFAIMTMDHYIKLKSEMLLKGFRKGEGNDEKRLNEALSECDDEELKGVIRYMLDIIKNGRI